MVRRVDISIGLPNTLTHPGPLMIEWAKRADERGFTSLSTIDRIVYPTYDTMTSLAVAAGATSRIGLLSGVLLAPLYQPVWLAKAAASLDAMSGGRLTLGPRRRRARRRLRGHGPHDERARQGHGRGPRRHAPGLVGREAGRK